MRQQRSDEILLLHGAAFGLKHQPHGGIFTGFVAHGIEHGEQTGFELRLLLRERFFARLDFRVGKLFHLFKHFLAAYVVRQFSYHQLPLPACQLFYHPAGAYFQAAAPCAVSVGNFGRAADNLPATSKVGPGQNVQQLIFGQCRVFKQRNASVCHFAQVVAGDFGCQAYGNAAGAIEQGKGQAGGQLGGLLRAAVVVGHKIDRAHVQLIGQQSGYF